MTGYKKIESRPEPPKECSIACTPRESTIACSRCSQKNLPIPDCKMADKSRKRKVLTLADRLKIIKAVEDQPSRSRTQIAAEFNLPLPTLSNILREKDKYLKQAASGEVVSTKKRARGSQLAALDRSLLDWFTTCRWALLIFL